MRLYPTKFNKKRIMIAKMETGNLQHLKSMKGSDIMAKEKTVFGDIKTFSDIFGGAFYPDLPREDFSSLVGKTYEITDATIIKEFDTQFGRHDLALLLLTDLETREQFTTISSGMVIVKKIRQILTKEVNATLPLIGTITKNDRYYDII